MVLFAIAWGLGVLAMYGVTRSNNHVEPRQDDTQIPTESGTVSRESFSIPGETSIASP
jgi:hypothetical protein